MKSILAIIIMILASCSAENYTVETGSTNYLDKWECIGNVDAYGIFENVDGDIYTARTCDIFTGEEFIAVVNDNGTPNKDDDFYVRVYSWDLSRINDSIN